MYASVRTGRVCSTVQYLYCGTHAPGTYRGVNFHMADILNICLKNLELFLINCQVGTHIFQQHFMEPKYLEKDEVISISKRMIKQSPVYFK